MQQQKPKSGKGFFGDFALPVAKRYLYPVSRNPMVRAGLLAGLALTVYFAIDFEWRQAAFMSGGPLSSAHANLSGDCASCHGGGFEAVQNEACSTCHEKFGDELGIYTFSAHYLYRSGDFQRLVPSEHEMPCASCHTEHIGRDADLTRVADAVCQTCHDFGSFQDGHPQFEFAANGLPDPAGLNFTHISHVQEVMDRSGLVDVEKACLSCHNPQDDGRNFQPISFDQHCDACHLTTGIGTPRLPVGPAAGEEPGVVTLASIQSSGAPGTDWSYYMNPGEFREVGTLVSKSPLHHEDPWVMENLRRLRRTLYPDPGLADLLKASADVPVEDLKVLYHEAVITLEEQAKGLRARPEPEIQDDLAIIEALLQEIKRALDDPYTALDETAFLLALEQPDPNLEEPTIEAIGQLVDDLTAPCTTCHYVDRATFVRVEKEQQTLRRAEFDHRAHIIETRCLDCHGEIPVEQALTGESVDLSTDRASVHNLPRIETCQECHTPKMASDNCTTCHLFHPDPNRRSDLLLYLD